MEKISSFLLFLTLSFHVQADFTDSDKKNIQSLCSSQKFSLEIAENISGSILLSPFDPNGFPQIYYANQLANLKGLNFLCPELKKESVTKAIAAYNKHVEAALADKDQGICSSYIESVSGSVDQAFKSIPREPYLVGAKAHGKLEVLDKLLKSCNKPDIKQSISNQLKITDFLKKSAFTYNTCQPLVKDFQSNVVLFNRAYNEDKDVKVTAENAIKTVFEKGQKMVSAGCVQYIQDAQNVLNQLNAALNDPNRASKVACNKSINLYQQKVSTLDQSQDTDRIEEFNRKALPAFESVIKHCAPFPDTVKQIEAAQQRWIYRK